MALVDLQHEMRDAVVNTGRVPMTARLLGGADPLRRLDIHRRHYEASLTAAVVGRFPATAWLVGSGRLEEAARQFVHRQPPTAPCIAEYGAGFPAFLAGWPATAGLTYVADFADLDWHLGRLAVCVDTAAMRRDELAAWNPQELADAQATLQSGTHYVRATWAVDELMMMYLTDAGAESWALVHDDVYLEARGARGQFQFSRISLAEYTFRVRLGRGSTFAAAAECAIEADPNFDPGTALLRLVDAGSLASIHPPSGGYR